MAAQKDDLWFLFHVGRVLEDGVFRRKMLALDEMYLNDDTRELEPIPIMQYDPQTRQFTGTDVNNIISNSRSLIYAASLNGIQDIASDINRKIQCLQKVNQSSVVTHQDVMNQIYDMYEQDDN